MNAYVFPGQGAQYVGMGDDLYEYSQKQKIYLIKPTAFSSSKLPM